MHLEILQSTFLSGRAKMRREAGSNRVDMYMKNCQAKDSVTARKTFILTHLFPMHPFSTP